VGVFQQICRFRAVNCTKMRLADPLGSYSAPAVPLAVIYWGGREGRRKKGLGIGRGRKGRERKDVRGQGEKGRGREEWEGEEG